MNEVLKKLYYDPKTGLSSINNLYARAKKELPTIKKQDVSDWMKKQEVSQIYTKPKSKKEDYQTIKCPLNSVGCLQSDLMDISRYSKYNKNYKFILNVIDIQTRYAWAFIIKNKEPKTILPHIKTVVADIRKQYPENPLTLTTDYGNEYKGSITKYLKEQNILHIQTLSKTTLSIAERFNRTMWNFIKQYTSITGKLEFNNKIDDFIENYNSNIHSTLQAKPEAAFDDIRLSDNRKPETYKPKDILPMGTKVRHQLSPDNKFEKKAFKAKYSKNVYYIVGKQYTRYILSLEPNGKQLKRMFLRRELKVIKEVEQAPQQPTISQIPKQKEQIRKGRNLKILDKEIAPSSTTVSKQMTPYRSKRLVSKPASLV